MSQGLFYSSSEEWVLKVWGKNTGGRADPSDSRDTPALVASCPAHRAGRRRGKGEHLECLSCPATRDGALLS